MAAMTVSKMAAIGICFKLVGCNGQKLVMLVSIIPYSNTGDTFIYFIFVLDHRFMLFPILGEKNEQNKGQNWRQQYCAEPFLFWLTLKLKDQNLCYKRTKTMCNICIYPDKQSYSCLAHELVDVNASNKLDRTNTSLCFTPVLPLLLMMLMESVSLP